MILQLNVHNSSAEWIKFSRKGSGPRALVCEPCKDNIKLDLKEIRQEGINRTELAMDVLERTLVKTVMTVWVP